MSKSIIYKSLSFSDLESVGILVDVSRSSLPLKVSSVTKNGDSIPIEELHNILYSVGISNNHYLEIQDVTTHRNLDNKVVEDYRFVGQERLDKVWLTSGYASDEVRMATSKMKDMSSFLGRLSGGRY